MSALALDIGTYSIKALSGKPGVNPVIEKSAEVFNSLGMAVPNDEAVLQQLTNIIETVLNDHKFSRNDVRLSLPETVVSTNIIELPVLSDAELASAIGWQAEQHIPIPPDQLSLEYQVLSRPKNKDEQNAKMRVLLVGAHKEIVERYIQLFLSIGIEPKIMETQILSLLRALQIAPDEPPTLMVQLGANSTQMAMVHEGELKFVTSQLSGGQALTQALERRISLDQQRAEEYKRTYGLNATQFEGKVREALLPVVDVLIGEMKKSITFFVNQNPQANAQRVLLSGGPTLLPGLVEYVTEQVGVEVLIAAPFGNASGLIPEGSHPTWSICVGLLMREGA